MVKSLVKTDNITVHSSNTLVGSKIAYIMEKGKSSRESISLKGIGLRAKSKAVNCNGQNQMAINTHTQANSTKTYKCTARVNSIIKIRHLEITLWNI